MSVLSRINEIGKQSQRKFVSGLDGGSSYSGPKGQTACQPHRGESLMSNRVGSHRDRTVALHSGWQARRRIAIRMRNTHQEQRRSAVVNALVEVGNADAAELVVVFAGKIHGRRFAVSKRP